MAAPEVVAPPLVAADDSRGRFGDSFFRTLTLAAGILIFGILALVSLYLIIESLAAITASPDKLSSCLLYTSRCV